MREAMAAGLEALSPPDDCPPSEWAEDHIRITDGDRVGPLSFGRGYEFQREMMDAFFGPFRPGEQRRVGVAYKGAQSGVTLLCQAGLLYWAAARQVSAFHLMPREFDATDKAKRLAEMIDAEPSLRREFPPGLLRVRKTRGGQSLRVAYSNSQAELKNWQAGVGVFDEVDELEGRDYDSVAMARQRMGAYRRRLEVYIGTPTLTDYGIHAIWEQSDQRQWRVPCPLCRAVQPLEWDTNITWNAELETEEAQAASARFVCAACGVSWDHRLRELANAEGVWVPTREAGVIGFGMNRLMVPSSIPAKLVSDYLEGLKSDQAMREHVNQNLGQCYLPSTGKLNPSTVEGVIDHSLRWGSAPPGTVVMTAGVDVQGEAAPFEFVWEVRAYDRSGVASVIAYGMTDESGMLDLFGQVGRPGQFPVARGLVDISDGHHKPAVERLCELCAVFEPARFDWQRQAKFDRGKVVKVKRGHRGYAVGRDDALQDNLGRFFEAPERGRRIRVAPCPQRALEREWVVQYTRIARVREDTARGPVYTYRKLRQKGVDFPFAGALAEFAFRHGGAQRPGAGGYGSVKDAKGRKRPNPTGGAQPSARSALRVVKRTRRRLGG